MIPIYHDCEAELVKFRDPAGAEADAREMLNSPIDLIAQQFPDSPFAQETYSKLYEQHVREPMPEGETIHRQEVIEFAAQNVRMRTNDSHLLMQRYFLHKQNFGEISREKKPFYKGPPIYSTIKSCHSTEVRRQNRMNKEQAEQVYPMNQSPYPN